MKNKTDNIALQIFKWIDVAELLKVKPTLLSLFASDAEIMTVDGRAV